MEKEIKNNNNWLVLVGNLQSARICSLSIYFHWNKTDNKFCFLASQQFLDLHKSHSIINIDKKNLHIITTRKYHFT